MGYNLIKADTFPEVWEKALKICWQDGIEVRTELESEYDPPSKDITAMLVVKKPLKEPRYHRAGFPMSIEDLQDYVKGFIDEIKQGPVEESGDTYPQRIINYKDDYEKAGGDIDKGINQLDYVLSELKKYGSTKKAHIVIWNPKLDPGNRKDSPDLIRLWFRIENKQLNMHLYMCSNDLFKATFANMMAFFELQKYIAEKLELTVGSYCHVVDSLHINGSYYEEVENTLDTLENRDWQNKTWSTREIDEFSDLT